MVLFQIAIHGQISRTIELNLSVLKEFYMYEQLPLKLVRRERVEKGFREITFINCEQSATAECSWNNVEFAFHGIMLTSSF